MRHLYKDGKKVCFSYRKYTDIFLKYGWTNQQIVLVPQILKVNKKTRREHSIQAPTDHCVVWLRVHFSAFSLSSSFVDCKECGRKMHQICVLHYDIIWPSGWVISWCFPVILGKGKQFCTEWRGGGLPLLLLLHFIHCCQQEFSN